MEEIWKPLIYKGASYTNFSISNSGELRNNNTGRVLKPSTNKQGYFVYVVRLHNKGKVNGVVAHRAVAETFIPNTHNKEQVNHIDGNKHNNTVGNLEWCTPAENMRHAVYSGLKTTDYCDGEKAFGAKLTREKVIEIRELYQSGNYTQKILGKMFGCTRENIKAIVNSSSWKNEV